MKKLFANIKNLPVLSKISAILLAAALLLSLSALFIGYIFDFMGDMFKGAFDSFPDFLSFSHVVLFDIIQILVIAAFLIAVISGSRKNIAFVAASKATLVTLDVLAISPFIFMLYRMTLGGYRGVSIGFSTVWSYCYNFIAAVTFGAFAMLMLGGFGKKSKLFGFIITGMFAFFTVMAFVDWVRAIVEIVKAIGQSRAIWYILALVFDYMTIATASMLLFVALGILSLSIALKKTKKAQPKLEENQINE